MRKLAVIIAAVMLLMCFTACDDAEPVTISEIYIQERSTLSMEVGQSLSGYVKVYSDGDLSLDDLSFVSSDESVVSFVSIDISGSSLVNYTIFALSPGEATLCVTANDSYVVSNSVSVSVNSNVIVTTPESNIVTEPATTATTTTTPLTTVTELTTTAIATTQISTITSDTTVTETETAEDISTVTEESVTTSEAVTTDKKQTATTKLTHAESEESADEFVSSNGTILLVDITSFVYNNNMASLTIQGKPNTDYRISVYYSSGESTAEGLGMKTSDSDGYVTWEWKVGARTKAGSHKIVISGGSDTLTVYFITAKE